jgi:hypothetical protein
MSHDRRYHFESFMADSSKFDSLFNDFINRKYEEGWKYKECHYCMDGGNRHAFCVFKRA